MPRWFGRRPRAAPAAAAALLALVLFVLPACAGTAQPSAPTPSPTPNVFTTPTPTLSPSELAELLGADYIVPESGFYVGYPKGWTVDTSKAGGFEAVFKAPTADSDLTGRAYPIIAVGTDVPEGYNGRAGREFLENTLKNGAAVLQGTLTDFVLISSGIVRLPMGDATAFEYTYTAGQAGKLHSIQIVIPGRSKLFLVTLTALDSAWAFHQRVLLAAASTFTVLAGK